MQNVIDMCNHILYYSSAYCGFEEPSNEMKAHAQHLMLEHGEEFTVNFARVYLQIQWEALNECY